ncbi:MAG: hypothetical protein ACK41T_00755 [Pseudobdellovibrio sp.]
MKMPDFSKSHCGVHQATYHKTIELMPELTEILNTLPDNVDDFTFDVKVHMLMPNQYPCIPNWHTDFVPRVGGIQRFDLCKPELPMYLWLSNGPLTQFKHGYVKAREWVRFNQLDEHRGIAAAEFGWRCFIRATHKNICPPKQSDWLRKHSQVYINAETYQW